MTAFKRILVGTDFSPPSTQAMEMALSGLCREPGAVIRVVHVLQSDVPNPLYAHYREADPEEREAARTKALEMMKTLVPDPPGDEVHVEYETPEGDPVVEVLKQARDFAADVIVVWTEGRTGLRGLLTASVAEHIVREAPCAVLVVK